jgi:hypothetical protein
MFFARSAKPSCLTIGLWKHADRIYRARFAELPSASKGTFTKSSVPHLIESNLPGVIVTGAESMPIDDRANKQEKKNFIGFWHHAVDSQTQFKADHVGCRIK